MDQDEQYRYTVHSYSLSRNVVRAIEQLARSLGWSRSQVVREAVRAFVRSCGTSPDDEGPLPVEEHPEGKR